MTDAPSPGWYPDPGGSGSLRWWDGSSWTGQVSTDADCPSPHPSRVRAGAVLPAVVSLTVLAVVFALWQVPRLFAVGLPDGPAGSSSSARTPEPTEPTEPTTSTGPRVVSPTATTRTAPTDELCAPRTSTGTFPRSNHPLVVHHLSMPTPAGWRGPGRDLRLSGVHDAWYYRQRSADERTWPASASVAVVNGGDADWHGPASAVHTLLACVLTAGPFTDVEASLVEYQSSTLEVDGHDAAQVDGIVRVRSGLLDTEEVFIRLIVVDVPGGLEVFFGAADADDRRQLKVLNEVTDGLEVVA